MAGYSGTPLAQKLGIKPQFRVALLNLPDAVGKELKQALAGCEPSKTGPLDFAMAFATTQKDLEKHFHLATKLAPAGMFWATWPKKSSGVATDLSEHEVRRIGL